MRVFVRVSSLLASFVVLSAAPLARAQQDPTGGSVPAVPTTAEEVTPPSLKTHEAPVYPPDALRDRVPGTVGLELTIDETGHVSAAKVTQPAGHGFDEAALAAVKTWTFNPAMRGGAPTASSVQLALPFEPPALAVPIPPPAPAPPPPSPPAPVVPASPSDTVAQTGTNQTTLVLGTRAKPDPISASASSTGQKELSLIPQYKIERA